MPNSLNDKLVSILDHFSLRARVFQAGPLCHSAHFDASDGLGYIHLLRDGALKVDTPGQPDLLLTEPSLILFMNPANHRLRPQTRHTDLVCASFDFGNGLKNPLAQALPTAVTLRLAQTPSLATTLQLLFTEAQSTLSGQQSVLDRLIEVIIIQLLRALVDQHHFKIGLLAGLAEPGLARAITAIHTEPAKPWTLQNLAEAAGMSRARFASRFREIVGTTPGHYLSEWRIGVAQTLLRRGKPIELVADAVGYANASALSRAFTAQVGASPAKWKKLHSAT